ncbi:hypothetical protein SB775_25510 [Peribacillus sp. SIMBA_075]|uniref:hypothetical protein n=1 Tax=Peribacillus sp. SIMBA_075 TaxID=3085813 RepID=UPI0039797E83
MADLFFDRIFYCLFIWNQEFMCGLIDGTLSEFIIFLRVKMIIKEKIRVKSDEVDKYMTFVMPAN